jgi:capsular polysaccharide biosynthesis protein
MLGDRLSRSAAPLIGAVAGLIAAGVLTLLQDPTYRADASLVLVRQGQPPGSDPRLSAAARSAAELFDSRAVAASAIQNLGLDESPDELVDRLEVESEQDSSLVRIEVEAKSRDGARQVAQEVAEVSSVLFNDRFGPQTAASVWEPASAEGDAVSPNPARNLALGALLGALAGWALLLGKRRPARPSRPKGRASPRPAPVGPVPGPVHAVEGPVPGTVPVAAPALEKPESGPFVMPGFGEWTIADVERLVAEQGPSFPERQEEIELYLETFRSVAGAGGRLPGDVDLVIEDVYADLIARSGSVRRS